MKYDHSEELAKTILLTTGNLLSCTCCGVQEHVFPMDDQPIDEAFVANYLCGECEEKSC